jgi:hypothetical protein
MSWTRDKNGQIVLCVGEHWSLPWRKSQLKAPLKSLSVRLNETYLVDILQRKWMTTKECHTWSPLNIVLRYQFHFHIWLSIWGWEKQRRRIKFTFTFFMCVQNHFNRSNFPPSHVDERKWDGKQCFVLQVSIIIISSSSFFCADTICYLNWEGMTTLFCFHTT